MNTMRNLTEQELDSVAGSSAQDALRPPTVRPYNYEAMRAWADVCTVLLGMPSFVRD